MHNLLGADLVGWWNFDEDTGNIAKDSSGYGNDGTLKNFNFNDSSGWSNDTPSPSGYSLKFDGSNDLTEYNPTIAKKLMKASASPCKSEKKYSVPFGKDNKVWRYTSSPLAASIVG